ncbi:MAG: putative transcriptional regulator [Psychromonas sp.]|jgi:putative transcriptional regulator|uniref:ChrR family anti-sigma-E factor n=1 Tax=Psychromonas sp. TaxID=1884585 RepID=UPI0039E584A8
MIKHHPSESLLAQYCAGELPFSLSIALSAHIEMCPHCQTSEKQREAEQATQIWDEIKTETVDLGDLLQSILATPIDPVQTIAKPAASIALAGEQFTLPHAFRSFNGFNWSGIGPVNRARVIRNEKNVRASLLHISAGGEIPAHQHKGYELTLLLDGRFSDEQGSYNKGDFILLQGDVNHSPKTDKGCLCYTVQDAPLHFTRGMSKVLNPLGKLIY